MFCRPRAPRRLGRPVVRSFREFRGDPLRARSRQVRLRPHAHLCFCHLPDSQGIWEAPGNGHTRVGTWRSGLWWTWTPLSHQEHLHRAGAHPRLRLAPLSSKWYSRYSPGHLPARRHRPHRLWRDEGGVRAMDRREQRGGGAFRIPRRVARRAARHVTWPGAGRDRSPCGRGRRPRGGGASRTRTGIAISRSRRGPCRTTTAIS